MANPTDMHETNQILQEACSTYRREIADLRQQLAEAKERLQELYDQANIYGANPPRMMPTRIVIRTAGSILYPATGKGDPDGRVEGN